MEKIEIRLHELLLCVSNAQDLISPMLTNHHQQTAYLAFRIAEEIKLPAEEQQEVFLAALIHDIGALSVAERLDIIEREPGTVNNHAFKGAKLLKGFKPLTNEAEIIRYHHQPWYNGKGRMYFDHSIPLASHIVHLADRVCSMLRTNRNVLTQVPGILTDIGQKSNTVFEPNLVGALFELAKKDYIWLDLVSHAPVKKLPETIFETSVLDMDDIIDLTRVYSHIIDFRSKYTARHSAGVAKTAEKLAEFAGFTLFECKMMLAAGYLHDLGKLMVNKAVLEKPAKLNKDEFNEIRSHPYYTYRLLDAVPQLNTIKTWASYHHERLDGMGYPFHIKDGSLAPGSRIMAVADVFTAVIENRPHRKGMEDAGAKQVLNNMAESGAFDRNIVELLMINFSEINIQREQAQREAASLYEQFLPAN